MYLKRKIYERLVEWKNDTGHSTLEVNGARQVGKTYIINKFADENFEHKIYINLFDLSGKQFMECYRKATEWIPGNDRPEFPLQDAFRLYDKSFQDTEDTVIIIDEIQESSEIYNRIREFTRQFKSHFIITGSYLGRVLEPEFKYASGDITKLQIYTLSFEEFLEAVDEELYQKYLSMPLLEADDKQPDVYASLKETYDLYCRIGGYPKVVEAYLEKKDLLAAQKELVRIIQIFLEESMRYFKDITDISVFTNIFLSICRILLREKKGLDENSISEELQKLVTKNYSSNLSKETCNRAINWLYHSGIIGFCGKIVEMDLLDFKPGRRCFFMDLGVASYYLNRVGTTNATINGTLNENYVYINLLKRQNFPEEITFEMPAFATYKGGEIDYVVQSIESHERYLIEVKTGKGSAQTAMKALQDGKADKLLYLKGNTKGEQDGKILTLPLYMLERFGF
ncbi:ATP-binding protein [Lachnospiraceae bacterium HCP1S3_A8]